MGVGAREETRPLSSVGPPARFSIFLAFQGPCCCFAPGDQPTNFPRAAKPRRLDNVLQLGQHGRDDVLS